MPAIANLSVNVTARTGKFLKGMKRVTNSLKSLGGIVTATAGLAGFGLLVKNSLESIDALGKNARAIGITAKSLVGLKQAAEISGVGVEQVVKGMKRLGINIQEASLGLGQAKDAFKILGVSAKDFTNLPLDVSFGILSDKLNTLTSQTQKAFVANRLMGRAGVDLLNVIELGSEGFKKFTESAEKLGIALTASGVKAVENANDSILRAKRAIDGIVNSMTIRLSPALEHIGNVIAGMAVRIRENNAETIISTANFLKWAAGITGAIFVADKLVGVMLKVISTLKTLGVTTLIAKAIASPATALLGLAAAGVAAAASVEIFNAAMGSAKGYVSELAKEGKELQVILEDVNKELTFSQKEANRRRESVGKATDTAAKKLKELAFEIDNFGRTDIEKFLEPLGGNTSSKALHQIRAMTKELKALETEQERVNKLQSDADSLIQRTLTPLEKYNNKLEEWKELLAEGLIDKEVFNRAIKEAKKNLDKLADPKKSLTKRAKSPTSDFKELSLDLVSVAGLSRNFNKVQTVKDPALLAAVNRTTQSIKTQGNKPAVYGN